MPRGERSCIGKARVVREMLEDVGDMTPEIGKTMGDPTQCHRLISRMCDNWSTKDADEFYDKEIYSITWGLAYFN